MLTESFNLHPTLIKSKSILTCSERGRREFIAQLFSVNSSVCVCSVLVYLLVAHMKRSRRQEDIYIPDEAPKPITISSLQYVLHKPACPSATTIPQAEYKQLSICAGLAQLIFLRELSQHELSFWICTGNSANNKGMF